jgi:alpha-N-arabinofuranosidase
MKTNSMMLLIWQILLGSSVCAVAGIALAADSTAPTASGTPTITINADQIKGQFSPMLYGLMTEEINYSYEGGIYGELIRNRAFKANATNAVSWSAVGGGSISLDNTVPLNDALNVSLKLDATKASDSSPAGIANGGYWGIPVKPTTAYQVSFYAKAASGFSGALAVNIQSEDGKTTFASATIPQITGDWHQYEATLTTKDVPPSKDNEFTITTTSPGTIWFDQVSLFPPTFNNRANGDRPDIMQLLADLQPKFLRLPGGNYL